VPWLPRSHVNAQELRFLRPPRHLIAVGLAAFSLLALLALGAGIATTEPAAVEAKRAEVARIQQELASIDAQVGAAAEAYNGAVYELGQVQDRIVENRKAIAETERNLVATREILAERLRNLYATPEPSLAEVLITSGSISAAADKLDLLDRVGQQDALVVEGLRANRARLGELRQQLLDDEQTAENAVDAKQQQKEKVEGLLRQRQQVLDGVKGELAQLLKAEEERARREAAAAALVAQQREAAAVAASGSSGGSFAPSASVTPSAPLPSGSGNAAAASVAMQYLGVPYVWGGASPSGFDCSGLASYAYAQIGKSVPHFTGAIYAGFPHVPSGQEQVGDLVFFNGLGHMGIYIGGGQFVHAPHTGDVVKVSNLSDRGDYIGAVRP
jgi:cell wall-associated NlpC family hydrolase